MSENFEYKVPPTGWISGFPLDVSFCGTGEYWGDSAFSFITLNALGEVALGEAIPNWSLNLNMTDTSGNIHLFCNGFFFPEQGIKAFVVDYGVLCAEIPEDMSPRLFSLGQEVDEQEDSFWLNMGEYRVLLRKHVENNLVKFVLVVAAGNREELSKQANRCLEMDLQHMLFQACKPQITYFKNFPEAGGRAGLYLEELKRKIGLPKGPFSHRWSISKEKEEMGYNCNEMLALIDTWKHIDLRVAKELLSSALLCQDEHGFIPQFIAVEKNIKSEVIAWPVFVQCAYTLWELDSDNVFIQDLLPHLIRYLRYCISYFDPEQTGLPSWQDPDEPLVPEIWDEDLIANDLSILLENEINALLRITGDQDTKFFFDYLQALLSAREKYLWQPESKRYLDRYRNGDPVLRVSFPSFTPLLSSSLTEKRRNILTQDLFASSGLFKPHGLASWEEWEDDEMQAIIHPLLQIFALRMFKDTGNNLKKLLPCWENGLHDPTTPYAPIPEDLNEKKNPTDGYALQRSSPGALSFGLLAATEQASDSSLSTKHSKPVTWLEEHRRSIVTGILLSCALFIGWIVQYYNSQPYFTGKQSHALFDLASHMHKIGQYNLAINLFTNVISHTRENQTRSIYELRLANTYFANQEYEKAEKLYQKLTHLDTDYPQVFWNLGQSLYQLGKLDEAEKAFNSFNEEYGTTYPQIEKRVQLIMEIIEDEKNRALLKEKE